MVRSRSLIAHFQRRPPIKHLIYLLLNLLLFLRSRRQHLLWQIETEACPPARSFEAAHLLNQLRHQTGPARLVIGAETATAVAVEILVEEHQITPVLVGLELLDFAVDRTAPITV